MRAPSLSVTAALRTGDARCIAFIGAGGKTTTMLTLAHEATAIGRRIIISTTTRIWPPPGFPLVVAETGRELLPLLTGGLANTSAVAAGRSISVDGKVHGIDARTACDVLQESIADLVLIEADGSAGRPAKGHRLGEPVMPPCADLMVVISGANVVGHSLDARSVHRPRQFALVTGATESEPVTATHLARSMSHMARFAPPGAQVRYLITHPDNSGSRLAALATARVLADSVSADEIVLGTLRSFEPYWSAATGYDPSWKR